MCDNCHKKSSKIGPRGPRGGLGPIGPVGPAGPTNTQLFSYFYNDLLNNEQVFPDSEIQFPLLGPTNTATISKLTQSSFLLNNPGIYNIRFQISIIEEGQIGILLQKGLIFEIVASYGRSGTNSQIVGDVIFSTNYPGSIIYIKNFSSGAVTITGQGNNMTQLNRYGLTITKLSD
jgi:hypothetical protein